MGASSSTQQQGSSEQRQVESLAASIGALPMLQASFSKLAADPQTSAIPIESLQKCFTLNYENPVLESTKGSDSFLGLLDHLGGTLVDTFFVAEKGGLINWIEFVKGYVTCCGRMTTSMSITVLLRLFAATLAKSGNPSKLEFESIGDDGSYKVSGYLLPADVLLLLCISWAMLWDSKNLRSSSESKGTLVHPDVSHLVLSSVVSCVDGLDGVDLWDCDLAGLDVQLPAGKFLAWALATIPCLTDCLTQFMSTRLQNCTTSEDDSAPNTSASVGSMSSATNTYLLTCGSAWAISLSIKSAISVEILKPYLCFDGDQSDEHFLYRSSVHGKGMNRFWSNVEGYHGPLLILVSATSGDSHEESSVAKKWVIGALTQQGLENKDQFYGTSATLYSIFPVFHAFPSSGKEKNFVYSHLHPAGRAYDPNPKPVGLAFGGSMGNERIFLDEDFAKITVRHHVVDKTYQHGSLFPNQGYLPVEASVSEVEVWGLGGETARSAQTSYKKREELFTEQRRKVDLKTFANWEDSPEKMMMDMIGNPNTVRREDR
ncbi:hypothetical protein LINPERHAP1_LOCUS30753 [Linum perenne]